MMTARCLLNGGMVHMCVRLSAHACHRRHLMLMPVRRNRRCRCIAAMLHRDRSEAGRWHGKRQQDQQQITDEHIDVQYRPARQA
jgi:hypothetical protein